MKRKLVSLVLATAMVTSSMMAMPVFASDDTATEETAEETPEANPELADKKSWCLYLSVL